jgi:hypothetical protein
LEARATRSSVTEERVMSDDLSNLCDRIRVLVERRNGVDADDVEHTLTDGYARALALEGERRRTEGRILKLAGNGGETGELRVLTGELDRIEEDLARLRHLLGVLAATL